MSGRNRLLRPRAVRAAIALASLWLAAATAHAQGPGFANVPRQKGELLAGPIAPSIGRTAVLAYHQGLLLANPESPGSAPGSDLQSRAFDISDPANPVATVVPLLGPNSSIAAHGYWQEGPYLRGLNGGDVTVEMVSGVARFVRRDAPGRFHFPQVPGTSIPWVGRGLLFQPFQAQMWWSYGATNHDGVLFRGAQQLATWDHIGQTGVVGHPFLLGNVLYVASDQSQTGVAAYDITPSLDKPGTPPTLIGLLKDPVGGYWPEIWGGNGKLLILFPARNGGRFQVADVTDPSAMHVVADRQLPNGGDPSYAQFQDGYAFMDRYKLDMRNDFAVDLVLDAPGHAIDVSQFSLPIGNLVVTGGIDTSWPAPASQGLAIWAHQAEPDTTGPSVGFHIPRSDQTDYPTSGPITLLIHETLRTETIVNGAAFLVQPLAGDGTPGAPLAGRLTFSFDDILTFTPDAPFAANTTYAVTLPAGGIEDAAGNGMVPYSFRFSTGATLGAGNEAPAILDLEASHHPAPPGGEVTLFFAANDPEGSPVEFRVDFGDGSDSGWISGGSVTHVWTEPGHFDVVLFARDASGATSLRSLVVTVLEPPSGPRPTSSAPIAFDEARRVAWNVNPDNDSVTRMPETGGSLEIPLGAGARPRSVAVAPNGNAWVTCEGRDEILVLSAAGTPLQAIPLEYGSAPFGIAMTPDGDSALVTLHGRGELRRFSTATRLPTGALPLGPTPRALAVTGDGARALVTRLISPDSGGEVWDVALGSSLELTRTIVLPEDVSTPDTAFSGRGLPNTLTAIAIDPFGRRAWVAAKKDNIQRGTFVSGTDLGQENTVRALVAEIDLAANAEVVSARRDVDNADSPSGITFSPLGDWAFVTLQGNNVVAVFDALVDASAIDGLIPVVARFATGRAPQGAALDLGERRLLVHDFLSRGVSRLSIADFLEGRSRNAPTQFAVAIAEEALPPAVLAGKQIFYNASDDGGLFGRNRMSGEGYLSCATCHLDGGHDGRTWDFSGRGEGLRNTTDLRGRRGMGHGRVHWSANFDEIQDFENDIRGAFGGAGFLSDDQFGWTQDPLGTPKTGRSAELDALAAYVSSLGPESIPRSPLRSPSGAMTSAGLRGAAVFADEGCANCHDGGTRTDSALATSLLHDVGTLSTSSGGRLGGPLPGIDTPTLLGVVHAAPYLHDGSAATLEDVFDRAGARIHQAEAAILLGNASAQPPTHGGIYHEGLVAAFASSSSIVRFVGVDGGIGGPATLGLRYSALFGTRQATLRVNGTPIALSLPRTPNEPSWTPTAFRTRFVEATLAPGATNTIEIQPAAGHEAMAIDDLAVVNASNRAAAHDHRRIGALAPEPRADLLAYLGQLDGSDDPRFVPEPGAGLAFGAALVTLMGLRRHRHRARLAKLRGLSTRA